MHQCNRSVWGSSTSRSADPELWSLPPHPASPHPHPGPSRPSAAPFPWAVCPCAPPRGGAPPHSQQGSGFVYGGRLPLRRLRLQGSLPPGRLPLQQTPPPSSMSQDMLDFCTRVAGCACFFYTTTRGMLVFCTPPHAYLYCILAMHITVPPRCPLTALLTTLQHGWKWACWWCLVQILPYGVWSSCKMRMGQS